MRFLATIALGIVASVSSARAIEPIHYNVSFSAPQTHYLDVTMTVPTTGRAPTELMIPVWTPGSYLVREYARHFENLKASTPAGKPLSLKKTAKNRWTIDATDSPSAIVTYRVYCREMGVQTNWVDASFAMINGAPTFLTLADRTPRPHEVTITPPPGWLKSYSGLKNASSKPHHFLADDYDILVDSPIYVGNPTVYEFEVDGKRHYLVNEGEGGIWDGPRSAKDVETIVRTHRDFWRSLPYDHYVFFNILSEAGGGLEHRNSTILMASRWATRRRADYLGWLRLVSHEYFHTWNVKRLRPVELGPFDYEKEVLTKSLWIAEGLTSYYGDLLVRRAGLATIDEYLAGDQGGPSDGDKPKNDIERLQEVPGRLVQPLESSSFDSWIKFYRRDENTPNTGVSYYVKGAVVGFLLDAKIQKATKGLKSLDDVMREAYLKYSGVKGYTPEQFRTVANEVAGVDLGPWFRQALETTDELDYAEAFEWLGLRFAPPGGDKDKKPAKAWLGLTTKNEEGRLMVAGVKRQTPGFEAGFNVGDELVAIGEDRVLPEQWSKRMEQYRPNERVSILTTRRGRLIKIEATFAAEPQNQWKPEIAPNSSPNQKSNREAWLNK
jgi:predicted metalloprotease with PDZ domain